MIGISVFVLRTVFVQENTIKLVPGHTGAAVIVAEGQHVTVGIPGALSIQARFIV